MHLEARAATLGDLSAVASLLEAASGEAAGERGGQLFVELARSRRVRADVLKARLGDEASLVSVGVLDDFPVGVALARLGRRFTGGRLATIEALYVEPGARAVGMGEALLDHVTTWADAQGATGLDVCVLPGVREAKNFFESAGYRARYLVMHRELAPGGG